MRMKNALFTSSLFALFLRLSFLPDEHDVFPFPRLSVGNRVGEKTIPSDSDTSLFNRSLIVADDNVYDRTASRVVDKSCGLVVKVSLTFDRLLHAKIYNNK